MWLIEKIKAWRDRRIECKIKRLERKYGVLYFHAPMGTGREDEYAGGKTRLLTDFFLEKERQLRKELENDPKLCVALACMQEQRRQQEILNDAAEACENFRRACRHKTYGNICPVLYRPRYDTSVFKEVYENDVLGNIE